MAVYVIAQAKGGVGKTTTAAEVVAGLAARGRRVLGIDLDQNGTLTTRLGITADSEVVADAADVLLARATALEAAVEAPSVTGAHIIVGTHALADLDTKPEVITSLRDYLPTVGWDDVVIDTPPHLGLVTMAALAAADHVIAPVACSTEDYDQLQRLSDIIEARIAPRLRPGLTVSWIVPTRHDRRRLLDREVVSELEEHYPGRVTTPVREAVAVKDSYTQGTPVSVYDPKSNVAADYAAAIATIIDQEGTP